MQELVCCVCGRRKTLPPGASRACPSRAASISAPALSSFPDDDSATRPIIPPIPPIPAPAPAADLADETTKVAMSTAGAQQAERAPAPDTPDVTADFPM